MVILRARTLKSFPNAYPRFTVEGAMAPMPIRHGVYFAPPVNFLNAGDSRDTIVGWLLKNCSHRFSIQSSHIFFEDEADATLCHLAFA